MTFYRRIVAALLLLAAAPAAAQSAPHWTAAQASRLVEWLRAAADDGLGSVTPQAAAVEAARHAGDASRLDDTATRAAVQLLEAFRQGCCNASLRTGWHIDQTAAWGDAGASVAAAVDNNGLDRLFGTTRPSHPFYYALRTAYGHETDPARRATLAANLDRWRWMPRALGRRYLLVNTAAFDATLWEDRQMVGRWKIVAGKTKSPTPIFAATVTGVVLNPWWEIPSDIAAENVAALLRDHPDQAAAKGYVLENGRYRQRPGPTNALGKMKLVMPNGFHVYLHDTPSQSLFDRDVRAYSHGCVRVGDALGLATALLAPQAGWDRARVEALVATGQTRTVALGAAIPVYVAYFTAEPDGQGGVRYFPDIYHRDTGAKAPGEDGQCAPGDPKAFH